MIVSPSAAAAIAAGSATRSLVQRHPPHRQVHQRRRLVEGGMRRDRQHQVAAECAVATRRAAMIAGRLHRHDDAFRPARGHVAGGTVGAMEQVQPHADHLLLHALQAGEGPARAERVLGEKVLNAACRSPAPRRRR